MKHASLLIALCVLFGVSAIAQSTTTVEKNAKRITITTKKVDENGKSVTETYIVEGAEPVRMLEEMAVNPEVIERVESTETTPESSERLFLFRRAGEGVTIEGTLNEVNGEDEAIERIIVINKGEGKKIKAHAFGWSQGFDSKSNCAALGVFVHDAGDSRGSMINSLIEKGGASAAGMKPGDVINRIEEFEVNDYPTLHLALSHFRPGDHVSVQFKREGISMTAKVELKDWRDLPGHEWRSRSDCTPEVIIEEEETQSLIEDPVGPSSVELLELQDAVVYPNPTEGRFSFSFLTEPGPLTVSVTDVNGKIVYEERNENPTGDYQKDINLRDFPQGNYILSVKQGDKVFSQQISKQ